MRSKHVVYRLLPVVLALATAVMVATALGQTNLGVSSALGLFQSPIDAPSSAFDSPLPTPLPSEPAFSEAAQRGLAYISKRENIPIEALTIAADHLTEYPALGQKLQVVTLLDTRPGGQVYKLLVNLADSQIEEDISALLAAEARAHQVRYGKLEPALHERLQTLENVDSNNTYLSLSPISRPGPNDPFWHATATASAAASFHNTYRGVAHGATILSVGESGEQADEILALQWAFDQGAYILNNSPMC
jgi:hypothetical protein